MKVVLDTSAIIYLNDFRKFDEILTVQEVVEEVKDKVSSMKLSGLRFKVIEPSKTSINEIKKIAKETGDLEKLSNTDIKVLALAKEKNCTVISDDRNVQNIAEKLNIKYVSIYNEKITKLIVWKKFCRNCRKKYEKGNVCSVCGTDLVRIPESSREVAGKDL
jgi:UPF0271 protein